GEGDAGRWRALVLVLRATEGSDSVAVGPAGLHVPVRVDGREGRRGRHADERSGPFRAIDRVLDHLRIRARVPGEPHAVGGGDGHEPRGRRGRLGIDGRRRHGLGGGAGRGACRLHAYALHGVAIRRLVRDRGVRVGGGGDGRRGDRSEPALTGAPQDDVAQLAAGGRAVDQGRGRIPVQAHLFVAGLSGQPRRRRGRGEEADGQRRRGSADAPARVLGGGRGRRARSP